MGAGWVSIEHPQIIKLKSDAFLPDKHLKTVDSKSLAKALVQRFHFLFEAAFDQKHPDARIPVNPAKNSQILVSFNPDSIPGIIEEGFLNIHQIGDGILPPAKDLRQDLESEFLKIWLGGGSTPSQAISEGIDEVPPPPSEKNEREKAFDRLRPKYGYVDLRYGIAYGSSKFYTGPNEYGNAFAVLKEGVKARTTWVPFDSVEQGGVFAQDVHTFYASDLRKIGYFGKYLEAEIWGELTLEDVQEFRIVKPSRSAIALVKQTGLPVYEGIIRKLEGRETLDRGKLLAKSAKAPNTPRTITEHR